MSAISTTESLLRAAERGYGSSAETAATAAVAADAAARLAQVEEQRIANLINLLAQVSIQNRQKVLDELSRRLGFAELF